MNALEIICGVVLMITAVAIVVLTLAQNTKGKGLSGAIMGDAGMMAAGRERGIDAKMAQATRIAGIVFVVVAVLVSIVSVRMS